MPKMQPQLGDLNQGELDALEAWSWSVIDHGALDGELTIDEYVCVQHIYRLIRMLRKSESIIDEWEAHAAEQGLGEYEMRND